MPLQPKSAPHHTRTERYEASFTYTGIELEEVWQLTRPMELVPDTVTLVWVRQHTEPWRRLAFGIGGSRAEGHLKMGADDPETRPRRTAREIFDRNLGEVRPWARLLPGLHRLIQDIERELPD